MQLAIDKSPDIAIAGLALPHLNGVELAHKIGRRSTKTQVLIYTDRSAERNIIEALRAGARGYVVQLISEGRINKQIGTDLHISVKTVETHRAKAMSKLNLRTTADLVRYAVRKEIVTA